MHNRNKKESINITPYKGRQIKSGQLVQVYRNLNKPGVTYSVRDWATGLVIGHTTNVRLKNCTFKVLQSGRNKVLTTGKKNVHAWIQGDYDPSSTFENDKKVRYNPYKDSGFLIGTTAPKYIVSAHQVSVTENGVFVK